MEEEVDKKAAIKEIIEWILCIIIAVVLALLVRHYVFTPTVVRQTSMYSTLVQGDRLILNRWVVTTHQEIERGDIVTFEAPSVTQVTIDEYDQDNPVAIYEYEPTNIFTKFTYYVLEFNKTSYIKRVIGVAGDHILIANGVVYINGEKLEEDYLDEETVTTAEQGLYYDVIVPEGYVYVLGDNREESKDSRYFGCVPIDKIEGRVAFRFWPFSKFGEV